MVNTYLSHLTGGSDPGLNQTRLSSETLGDKPSTTIQLDVWLSNSFAGCWHTWASYKRRIFETTTSKNTPTFRMIKIPQVLMMLVNHSFIINTPFSLIDSPWTSHFHHELTPPWCRSHCELRLELLRLLQVPQPRSHGRRRGLPSPAAAAQWLMAHGWLLVVISRDDKQE